MAELKEARTPPSPRAWTWSWMHWLMSFPLWGRGRTCLQLPMGRLCISLKMFGLWHTAWGLYLIRSPLFHWNPVWTHQTQRGAVRHPLPVHSCILIEFILPLAFRKLQLLSLFTLVSALLTAFHWFQQTHLKFPQNCFYFLAAPSSYDPGLCPPRQPASTMASYLPNETESLWSPLTWPLFNSWNLHKTICFLLHWLLILLIGCRLLLPYVPLKWWCSFSKVLSFQ